MANAGKVSTVVYCVKLLIVIIMVLQQPFYKHAYCRTCRIGSLHRGMMTHGKAISTKGIFFTPSELLLSSGVGDIYISGGQLLDEGFAWYI